MIKFRGLILVILILMQFAAFSQYNFYEKGNKALYWGISIAANNTNFAIERQPNSPSNDSFVSVFTKNIPGFNLGLIGNWQFNRFFDIRTVPCMTFAEKNIVFQTERGGIIENRLTTTYISFPLLLRFKTEPIKDWRIFILGGCRYDYLIIPQVRPKNEPNRITLNKHNFSMEYGVGLQYFFEYFIFSPEIKFSHGLGNALGPDQSERNHSILKGLFPRGFVISLNFEG